MIISIISSIFFAPKYSSVSAQTAGDEQQTGEVEQKLQNIRRSLDYDESEFDLEFKTDESELEDFGRDIGRQVLVQRRSAHNYYGFQTQAGYQVNDNARLNTNNETTDSFYTLRVRGSFYPNLPGRQFMEVYADLSRTEYSTENQLDINTSNVGLRYRYSFTSLLFDQASVFTGYTYENYMYGADSAGSAWNTFQQQHAVNLGYRETMLLSRYNQLFGSIEAQRQFTEYLRVRDEEAATAFDGGPDPEKTSYNFKLTHLYEYSQLITFVSSYNFTYEDYVHEETLVEGDPREDNLHSVSTQLILDWTDQFRTRANLSYSDNSSTKDFGSFSREYDSLSGGITAEYNF